MELWIRNQDRENLVKVGLLEINEIENDFGILTIYENEIANLGLYKTKERALEILDEIQNILQPKVIYKLPKMEDFNIQELANGYMIQANNQIEMELKQAGQFVYQMPEE